MGMLNDPLPASLRWGFTLGVSGVTPSLGVTENPNRVGIHKPIPRSGATPPLEGTRLGMPVRYF